MSQSIHTVLLADYPEHVEMVANWYFDWFHQSKGDYKKTYDWVNTLLGKDTLPITVIALEENKPVGVAGVWQNDHKDLTNLSPWMAAVYVPESYRGRGIARMLLQARLDIARELGFKAVYMWSEEKNWPIHQKLGWTLIDEKHKLFSIELN